MLEKQKANYTGYTNYTDYTNYTGSEEIQVLSLLGIIIYDKQKFNLHVDRICKSGSIQLNALIRLKKGIFKERL